MPPPMPSLTSNSRRLDFGFSSMLSSSIPRSRGRGGGESFRDREPLHGHGVGRAADRAETAPDALLVVLDHRGQGPSFAEASEGFARFEGAKLLFGQIELS